MTADIATQTKSTGPNTMLHTLTMTIAALTLLSALLAMIFGNRMMTLQKNIMKSEQTIASSKATTIKEIQNTLSTTQQALKAEKTVADKLRQQVATATKELGMVKADLTQANQALAALKSTLTDVPVTSPGMTTPPALPTTPPVTQTTSSPAMPPQTAPLPTPLPAETPAVASVPASDNSQSESKPEIPLSEESIEKIPSQAIPVTNDTDENQSE